MEPLTVEDKNRQVNSTQSILFQTNLFWKWYHHYPYNGHIYWSYLTGNVHFVSKASTSSQHENKHLNHLCTIQTFLQFNLYYIGHVILNLLLRSHISTDHDNIDCSLSDITNSQALDPNIRTYCAIQLQSNYKRMVSLSQCLCSLTAIEWHSKYGCLDRVLDYL